LAEEPEDCDAAGCDEAGCGEAGCELCEATRLWPLNELLAAIEIAPASATAPATVQRLIREIRPRAASLRDLADSLRLGAAGGICVGIIDLRGKKPLKAV
jgi:hypothetical protein